MLIAHLVPGYFAAIKSQQNWSPDWNRSQHTLLWAVAIGSTVAPDVDVIYNTLFRGFVNHSTLWTHSLIPYLGIGLLWWLLRHTKKWPFLRTLVGFIVIGGLSHLILDVIAHGTPLLYPISLKMFGMPPARVVEGGIWAYLTGPIFLLEPLALTLLFCHWINNQNLTPRVRTVALALIVVSFIFFAIAFLWFLPDMQEAVASKL